ncbi:AI-2E family transporter [Massilia horti]|uniref:AI-2E family transporter n=1 Tax=Massilia horti TaxID=2562153 RepID=A0A4Y9SYU6_9BURK|nr:AI-2E family transporter [Massilia horti]TFW31927.1 AI-2E family transporter [Massilia horti]
MFGLDMRAVRAIWTAIVMLGGLYCVYRMRTTLLVVLFAVFFSYLIYPLFELISRRVGPRVSRTVILLGVFVVILGLIVLLVFLFGSTFADQAAGLAQELPRLLEPGTLAKRLPLPHLLEPFRERLAGSLREALASGLSQALPAAQRLGASLVHAAGNMIYVVVVPIFSFLMIRAAPAVEAWLAAASRSDKLALWVSVAHDLNYLLSRYVRALGLLSLAALIAYSSVLSLLGAPFALLLAGVAALLEVIPVFGPLTAAVAILTVAAFSGYEHIWWLLMFLVAYRLVQDYMFSPYLMSEGVDVPAILVVFGILAGDELAGVAGIFLSVPTIAAIRIVARRLRTQRAAARSAAQSEP